MSVDPGSFAYAKAVTDAVRVWREKWSRTYCNGTDSDTTHGYVTGVHAAVADLEKLIAQELSEMVLGPRGVGCYPPLDDGVPAREDRS